MQTELFFRDAATDPSRHLRESPMQDFPAGSPASSAAREDALARLLEDTGRFRVLRRLEPRSVSADAARSEARRVGVLVDTETTGLDPSKDEVIEIAALAFTYDDDGIHDIVGTFEGLQEPRRPLTKAVRDLTGLTDAALEGEVIDTAALAVFLQPMDIVIAHNAIFDRPFCEGVEPTFAEKRWACSATEIDWKRHGCDSAKLHHLLARAGRFHGAHRALADCHALLEVLSSPVFGEGAESPFRQLCTAADVEICEIRAEGAPYSAREFLKEQGYRWDPGAPGRAKCWYTSIPSEKLRDELFWLRHEVYRETGRPVIKRRTAVERFTRR